MSSIGKRPALKATRLLSCINHGNLRNSSQDRLTGLPLELLRMIVEFSIDLGDFWSIQRLLKKRTTCKLFNAEIITAIVKFHDQPATAQVWYRTGAPFLRAALLKAKIEANPESPVLILALIHRVVDQIQEAQGDLSEETRGKWLDAACACVAHSRNINVNSALNVMLDQSRDGMAKFAENVRTSTWAVVAWEGEMAVLEKAMNGAFGVPPAHKLDSPRQMGSAQWAASYRDNLSAIEFLQTHNFDFGASALNNPLGAAAKSQAHETFQLLLSYMSKEDVNDIGKTGAHIVKSGNLRLAELIWDSRSGKFTKETSTAALTTLCREGTSHHDEMARLLIRAGANVNQASGTIQVDTPLTLAIRYGPSSLVQTLIKHGARPRAAKYEVEGGSSHLIDPLCTAIKVRNLFAVEVLLECNPWQKLTRNNALLAAINAGDPENFQGHSRPPGNIAILELLLEGFDPESSKPAAQMGRGAIKRARSDGKGEMVSMLVDHGC